MGHAIRHLGVVIGRTEETDEVVIGGEVIRAVIVEQHRGTGVDRRAACDQCVGEGGASVVSQFTQVGVQQLTMLPPPSITAFRSDSIRLKLAVMSPSTSLGNPLLVLLAMIELRALTSGS